MLRKVWTILSRSERRQALVLLAFMTVGMLLEAIGVGAIVPAFAVLIDPTFGFDLPLVGPLIRTLDAAPGGFPVIEGALILVTIFAAKSAFLGFLAWTQFNFAYGVRADLSLRLFRDYMARPWSFHSRGNSSRLIQTLMGELEQFTGIVLIPSVTLVAEAMVSIGICLLLLAIDPVGAVAVGLTLGVLTVAYSTITNPAIGRWGEARRFHEMRRVQQIQEGLGGIKIVRLLGRQSEFVSAYDGHNAESARVARRQSTLMQLPRLGLEFLVVVALSALVLSLLTRGKSPEQTLAVVGIFAAAAFRLMPSANRVIASIQSLKYGEAIVDGLLEEVASLVAEPKETSSGSVIHLNKSFRVEDLSFTYPDNGERTVSRVSLTIQRGEYVGLIGPSGSGKSTLIDLLLGLHDPDAGILEVDGERLDSPGAIRAWQDQIGYVPQDTFLTDDSLRRNIAFGVADRDIDDAAVARAVELAQLSTLVRSLEEGLETGVGERGVRLSGGQRQRIGIARALYGDPDLLILDEATSALDGETEAELMAAIRPLKGQKTILMATHRLASLRDCDRVFAMERGSLRLDRSGVQPSAPAETPSAATDGINDPPDEV